MFDPFLNIPFFDGKYSYTARKEEIEKAIFNTLNQGVYIGGDAVLEFSKRLANYLEVEHVVTCGNGTDALSIALMALELKAGDEVIVPTFNFVAAVEAIALLGLVPVFVDASADDFNLDPQNVEGLITDKTKAIIVVHLFGGAAQIEKIAQIAQKYKLYVIEDVAQSLGSKYGGRFLGTFGHIGCTSFFPTKNLACFGDGGALFTNDSDLAKKIETIGKHGQESKYEHVRVGMNSRLDTLQAAILNVQLSYIDSDIKKRRRVANLYHHALKSIYAVKLPIEKEGTFHSFNQYNLILQNKKTRDELKLYLHHAGIETMIYYPRPIHEQKAFLRFNVNQHFPFSETLCDTVLALPVSPSLSQVEQEYIITKILNFFAAYV